MRLSVLLPLLIFIFAGSAARGATDPTVFSVREVPVDATAAGSAQARDTAIASGRARAFSALLRRLTLQADWPRLPGPESADLDRLVTGFEVGEERHSSTRYLAKVSYDFDPGGIRALLRGAGVPFSETRAKPVVVLPVLIGPDGKAMLWDDANLWAAIWRQQPVGQALVPMRVPLGDLADVGATGALNLEAPDWAGVQALAQIHGAAAAIVAQITVRQTAGRVIADIRLTDVRPGGANEVRLSADGADQNDALLPGVAVVANAVVEEWKQQTVVSDATLGTLTADVNFTGLNQWLAVRNALQNVPFVHALRIVGLAAGAARVEMDYAGTPAQLATGLAQADLSLTGSDATGWTIAPGGALLSGPAPAPPPDSAPPVDSEAASGH